MASVIVKNDITTWALAHVVMLFLGDTTMSQDDVLSRASRMSRRRRERRQSTHGMCDDDNERVPGKPLKPPDRTEVLPTHRQSVRPRV